MVEQQQQQEKTKQQSRPFNNSINNCHRKFCFANISAKIQIDCEMQTGSGLFISMVRVNSVTHQFMRRFFLLLFLAMLGGSTNYASREGTTQERRAR